MAPAVLPGRAAVQPAPRRSVPAALAGSEVDFVVGDSTEIEVKATGAVTKRDLTGLRRLAKETPLKHRIVVCRESAACVVDGIRILPVMEFLRALWNGELIRN